MDAVAARDDQVERPLLRAARRSYRLVADIRDGLLNAQKPPLNAKAARPLFAEACGSNDRIGPCLRQDFIGSAPKL